MTLTAVLPSFRQSLPDPLQHDAWPPDTIATLDDLLVGGVSILADVQRIGVPLVHGDGVRAIAVGRVLSRIDGLDDRVDLTVGVPDDLAYVWSEARVMGRISPSPAGGVRVSTPSRLQGAITVLPHDTAVGDLLAIPFVRA